MSDTTHWEAPIPRKLLITVHRLAEMLDVSYWKAREISYSLDQRFVGAKATRIRVTLDSVEQYIALKEEGLLAQAIMAERKGGGPALIEYGGLTPLSAAHRLRELETHAAIDRSSQRNSSTASRRRRRRRY